MSFLSIRTAAIIAVAATILTGCKKEAGEPALPTYDPMTKVQFGEGYKVGGAVAVDGKKKLHHMKHLVANYYNIDTKTPIASLTGVKPSCQVKGAAQGEEVHVIIARDGGNGWELSEDVQPIMAAFSKKSYSDIAEKRARNFQENGSLTRYGQNSMNGPRKMSRKDIVVTAYEKPVYVVLVGRYPTLYNFTVAPYAKVAGVLVYSDDEGAAVAGLDPSVPVSFQSESSPATKRCWVRPENKPDETWKDYKEAMRVKRPKQSRLRYHLMQPYYNKFAAKVHKDAGYFRDDNLIGVAYARYFLIGPAPTQLEQRIPYSPVAGSHIKFMELDHVKVGPPEEVGAFIKNTIDTSARELASNE